MCPPPTSRFRRRARAARRWRGAWPLPDKFATPDEPGRKLLGDAAAAMRLSARGFHRVIRVARTIADLAGAEQVGRIHVAEALSYRRQAPRN